MLRDDGNFQEIEVVDAKDHERIVAAKDAEIATLKKSLEDSMAQVMVAVLGETNTGWPHEKKLHETIAEQKRVIEKLKEQRNGYAELYYGEYEVVPYSPSRDDAELEAIEIGE